MNKNIKKRRKLINEQKLQLDKSNEKNKCDCPHTVHGDIDCVPSNNRRQGHLDYICKSCNKDLNFNKIPEATLREACTTVDNAIDTIKISLDLSNEKDAEVLEKLAECQYRIRNQIVQLYGKSLQKQGTGRRKNRNDRDVDSSWTKPEVGR